MNRLVVVSNRLPITVENTSQGRVVRSSTGGLVSALRPVLRRAGGCWIGAGEASDDALLDEMASSEGFEMSQVFLPQSLRNDYYTGFCNEILWPLFHDLQSRCNFEPRYWHSYVEANASFAAKVSSKARPGDLIWVHDYHLMLLGSLLQKHLDRRNILYFHHIPFPPPDIFEKLPWRKKILEALLGFGLVGFQSSRDRHNFAICVRRLLHDAVLKKAGNTLSVVRQSSETIIGTFPIGIDFEAFNNLANDPSVATRAQAIRSEIRTPHLILGVDRLDYTKGILERVKGFSTLLQRCPGLRGRATLVQIAVPSRESMPHYADLKNKLVEEIASVNTRFSKEGWTPIHYLNRHVSRPDLVAYYRAADVALVTPVRDGMNLVCKEFCASRVDEKGVLVLSEFAGAAEQLKTGAVLVNPYDAEGVATALCNALEMDHRTVSRRMRRMRNVVRRDNVFDWCDRIFSAVDAKKSPGGIRLYSGNCLEDMTSATALKQ